MILINKADFLTKLQRKYWKEYFNSFNIKNIICFPQSENNKNWEFYLNLNENMNIKC